MSVRSGSAMSMPGMMDTILNLGLNAATLQGLIARAPAIRASPADAYRRFIQLFGKIALGVPDEKFDEAMAALKAKRGAVHDVDLSADALQELAGAFLALCAEHTGSAVPARPVRAAASSSIEAVFRSWMGKRAVDYRRQFRITPGDGQRHRRQRLHDGVRQHGQRFGDRRRASPAIPAPARTSIYGEYLVNAQGEDVVAGIRTPKPIAAMAQEMPDLYRQLVALRDRLEAHYREVQDFEFTIERGRLYCLQTRNGKMNARAMVITSVEMVGEGLITKEQALTADQPDAARAAARAAARPGARGASRSRRACRPRPGAASGSIVFDADTAEQRGKHGEKVILVREETKPEDIHGFFAAQAILTSRGGKTSHAAVVARGMGKPCVSGCDAIAIDVRARTRDGRRHRCCTRATSSPSTARPATSMPARSRRSRPSSSPSSATLLGWADEVARLEVMANADTPRDAERARALRRDGHRPVPDRADVQRRRSGCRSCRR